MSPKEAAQFDATVSRLMRALGWTYEVIGDHDGFCLRPPAERPVACPTCQGDVVEIIVMTADPGFFGTSYPCGHRMEPQDLMKARTMP